jgi:hypothetical protein
MESPRLNNIFSSYKKKNKRSEILILCIFSRSEKTFMKNSDKKIKIILKIKKMAIFVIFAKHQNP